MHIFTADLMQVYRYKYAYLFYLQFGKVNFDFKYERKRNKMLKEGSFVISYISLTNLNFKIEIKMWKM